MNKHLAVLSLAVGLLASTAEASGIKRNVFNCGESQGQSETRIILDVLTTSAPGGPVRTQTIASIFSGGPVVGLSSSGPVIVEKSVSPETGAQAYINKDGTFQLYVLQVQTSAANDKIVKINATAKYVDQKSGEEREIDKKWYDCK